MRLRPPVRNEKSEQADCIKLLRMLGARVYVLGTVRRKGDYHGTMQTPGIADLEAWLPVPLAKRRSILFPRRLLKMEVKRSKGSATTPDQKAYASLCSEAGIDYVRGDLAALMAWLVAEGFLRADQLPASRQPTLEIPC